MFTNIMLVLILLVLLSVVGKLQTIARNQTIRGENTKKYYTGLILAIQKLEKSDDISVIGPIINDIKEERQ